MGSGQAHADVLWRDLSRKTRRNVSYGMDPRDRRLESIHSWELLEGALPRPTGLARCPEWQKTTMSIVKIPTLGLRRSDISQSMCLV